VASRLPKRGQLAWVHLLLAGLSIAAAVALVGVWRQSRYPSTPEALQRAVASEVEATLDARARRLRAAGTALRRNVDLGAAVAAGRAHDLFEALAAAADRHLTTDDALTVYAVGGAPIAWQGRASTLPVDRIDGPPAGFVAPGPTGLRYVRIEPIESVQSGRRVGTLAAETLLTPGEVRGEREYTIITSYGEVTLRPRFAGGAGAPPGTGVVVRSEQGEPLFEAALTAEALARRETAGVEAVRAAALGVIALTLLLLLGPLLDARGRPGREPGRWRRVTLVVMGLLALVRMVAWFAVPSSWRPGPPDATAFWTPLALRSPVDFFVSACFALALAVLIAEWVLVRRTWTRRPAGSRSGWSRLVVGHALAGLVATAALLAFEAVLGAGVEAGRVDLLQLTLQPWPPNRLALLAGLVVLHAALLLGIAALFFLAGTRVPRRGPGPWFVRLASWLAPAMVVTAAFGDRVVPQETIVVTLAAAALATRLVSRSTAWYRHGSQAVRLVAWATAAMVPALLLYPSLVFAADAARRALVEREFAQQAITHPEDLLRRLDDSRRQLDAIPALADLLASASGATPDAPPTTDLAFSLWQQTDLARYRLTSALEVYGPDRRLRSRFSLNFPEYEGRVVEWQASSCTWDTFGEAAPFGSEERRMLHAERNVCADGDRVIGALVVHVMPDYNALPFLSSRAPYADFFRPAAAREREADPGRDVGLVIYGWGRTPLFTSSGQAWVLDEPLFSRVYASRTPFWTRLDRGGRTHEVYFANDRFGIYALDYPVPSWFDHMMRLAELVTFTALGLATALAAAALLQWLSWRRLDAGTALVREFRTSFYRKLFLAFVASSIIPVLILALAIRTFVAGRMRADAEGEAARTAAVAQRVIEEAVTALQVGESAAGPVSDDTMVWISRLIAQDVNLYLGSALVATSERDLFASGMLPARAPAAAYQAIVLERQSSVVVEETLGTLRYLMAAAPIRVTAGDAMVTVPMASRQQEIEREIDDLDRGVQLGALLFILLGAGIGLWMAERIADPVQRLTRASRRIASGDLDARVFVRSADELRRLVESFNTMAFELQRQRARLERTNRLEAWAEMARQVAHDIKNPLTPIQLSAEHLRRVHRDRGEPLSPVLDGCVDTILTQVRLLRQIAGEFSSFASTPQPHPVETEIAGILEEVAAAYRTGLAERIDIEVSASPGLPRLFIDRMLVGRAITNVIENAIHAMPDRGRLTLEAARDGDGVAVRVRDTGVGMDADALSRLFEVHFSTKATGTGLGLSIAKRNIELHGGTIAVESARDVGTTVTLWLPLAGNGG